MMRKGLGEKGQKLPSSRVANEEYEEAHRLWS